MGMRVSRFEDIERGIRTTPDDVKLFCFFAFDDRPSHKPILDLLESAAEWLDGLSATSGIRTFVFARSFEAQEGGPEMPDWMYMERMMSGEEHDFLDALSNAQSEVYPTTHHNVYVNPTLTLATRFGVKPRDLPGCDHRIGLSKNQRIGFCYFSYYLCSTSFVFLGTRDFLDRIPSSFSSITLEVGTQAMG